MLVCFVKDFVLDILTGPFSFKIVGFNKWNFIDLTPFSFSYTSHKRCRLGRVVPTKTILNLPDENGERKLVHQSLNICPPDQANDPFVCIVVTED